MKKDELQKMIKSRVEFVKDWVNEDEKRKVYLFVGVLVSVIYFLSLGQEKLTYTFKPEELKGFTSEKILENPYKTIYDGKLNLLEETKKSIISENRVLREEIESLKDDLRSFIKKQSEKQKNNEVEVKKKVVSSEKKGVQFGESPVSVEKNEILPSNELKKNKKRKKRIKLSKSNLIFPVKMKAQEKKSGLVIGVGSWARGVIIAGAEIPQSKTYPVLIQLDQAYTMANKKSISLVGCLMVAKASPVMSTRQLEIQPQSMGCFSKSGKYFEKKDINGWGTDSLDSNFGIKGNFKSNINRLAEYSFVKSLLEGVQEIVARKSKSIGGVNPDRADLVVQEGAASTSTMVASFMMKQAKSLLPTLGVNSGKEVYIVMKDSIRMPYEFFDQEGGSNEEFDYSFSLLD